MRRHAWAIAALVVVLSAGAPRVARADISLTGFVGATTNPASRTTTGAAVGVGLLIVGVEFEYASSSEDAADAAPSLRTGMANLMLQTPMIIGPLQLYATIGGGGYREVLDGDARTNVGINYGGGVRVRIAGPLRIRIDYRLFHLYGSPRERNPQRVYAGLGLSF